MCLTGGGGGGRATALPGLQDIRGQWKGSWEAYGGGGGATSVEFGVRGEDWEWGDYGLDKVPPCGRCPSLCTYPGVGTPAGWWQT